MRLEDNTHEFHVADETSPLRIDFRGNHPTFKTLEQAGNFYSLEGERLGQLLQRHLSGGLLDATLAYLMAARASLLRVRYNA
jgi:hypothetical protein